MSPVVEAGTWTESGLGGRPGLVVYRLLGGRWGAFGK